MFCPYCGATNPDDAAFCRSCRRTISIPPDPSPQAATAVQPQWQVGYYDRPPAQDQYFTYAAFWPRAGAYLLDLLFATLIAAIPAVLLAILFGVLVAANQEDILTQTQQDQQDEDMGFAIIGGFLLGYLPAYFAYFTIATARGGGWGKRIVGLRILRSRDGALPGYGTAILRIVATTLLSAINLVQLLNYLWCIWDSQKQTWHDKIAGTVVVVAR